MAAADAVIAGAGAAGISCARHLAVALAARAPAGRRPRVLLADPRPPMQLTSARSTEAYRTFWNDAAMRRFMRASLTGMQRLDARCRELNGAPLLDRCGYLWCTRDAALADEMAAEARADPRGGVFDSVSAFASSQEGVRVLRGGAQIAAAFPYLSRDFEAAMMVWDAGFVDANQLGTGLLHEGRESGVEIARAAVVGVEARGGRVAAVELESEGGARSRVATPLFVNAAGPFARAVHALVPNGAPLPLRNELHAKVVVRDSLGLVPRRAPLTILADLVELEWSAEERAALQADADTRHLAGRLPPGLHFRPQSGWLLGSWEFVQERVPVPEPPPAEVDALLSPLYAEIVLRGLVRLAPPLRRYLGPAAGGDAGVGLANAAHVRVDGGFYCRAPDNRPVLGAASRETEGAFVCGGFSGYGIMGACEAGRALAAAALDPSSPLLYPEFALGPERLSAPPRHHGGLGSQL